MRNRARNGFKANARRGIQTRDGHHQTLRVRMGEFAVGDDRLRRRHLDHLSAVHDGNVVRHLRDNAEVVGDEQDGRSMLALEVVHQLQDLRLNGDVQRGGRFVRDEQLRLTGQRHSDHHALTHAAGELVRILLGDDFRIRNLNVRQHLDHFLLGFFLAQSLMDDERLGNLAFDGEHRVQAGHRLLEDDGDRVAANLLHLGQGHLRQVFSVKHDAAAGNIAVTVQQLEHAHRGNALAGAGLADDAERSARFNFIGYTVHRLDDAAFGGEECFQILHFKQCHNSSPPYLTFECLRVERIAQTVANQVDTNGADAENRRREHPLPPILLDDDGVVRAVEQVAPRRGRQRNAEAEVLKKQEGSKRTLIAGLKKQEKQLKREIDRKRKQAEALDRKLEQLIAEEERKSSTRADKTEGKNSTAQQRPTKGYKMTKEELALSGSFEKNKGKLPFPLSGSYKIVAHFGRQKHPELRYVQTENSGIDIETTPGTKARAVFNGVVSRIFVTPGYNSTIIVRHGNYLTIYANLSEVYVRAGEKVSTGQNLGKIYSDSQDGNRTILTFQLWKERTKLNPELWLNL